MKTADAFAYHRARNRNASDAIKAARLDVANYRAAMEAGDTKTATKFRRYAPGPNFPAVTWQPGKPGVAFVLNPKRAGLREIGAAHDFGRSYRYLYPAVDHNGWFNNDEGESARDGSGLIWGVVYQLPARDGLSRFVAGYMEGDSDGVVIDFGTIYTEPATDCESPFNNRAARDAARAGDTLAKWAAEDARDWNRAWRAGVRFAEMGDEIAAERAEAREALATRRAIRADMIAAGVDAGTPQWRKACGFIHAQVAASLERIAKLRRERADLAQSIPTELASAFGDGAGCAA